MVSALKCVQAQQTGWRIWIQQEIDIWGGGFFLRVTRVGVPTQCLAPANHFFVVLPALLRNNSRNN